MTGTGQPSGLLQVLEASRATFERYLRAHGAGDSVEDLMQELALRVSRPPAKPIANPMGFLYRAATNLMIDHRRSAGQAMRRDSDWADAFDRDAGSIDPAVSPERVIDGRTRLQRLEERLATLPERARRILIRHRVDGVPQRAIADEMSVSLSTVEADLRLAYAAIADLRRDWEKAERQ